MSYIRYQHNGEYFLLDSIADKKKNIELYQYKSIGSDEHRNEYRLELISSQINSVVKEFMRENCDCTPIKNVIVRGDYIYFSMSSGVNLSYFYRYSKSKKELNRVNTEPISIVNKIDKCIIFNGKIYIIGTNTSINERYFIKVGEKISSINLNAFDSGISDFEISDMMITSSTKLLIVFHYRYSKYFIKFHFNDSTFELEKLTDIIKIFDRYRYTNGNSIGDNFGMKCKIINGGSHLFFPLIANSIHSESFENHLITINLDDFTIKNRILNYELKDIGFKHNKREMFNIGDILNFKYFLSNTLFIIDLNTDVHKCSCIGGQIDFIGSNSLSNRGEFFNEFDECCNLMYTNFYDHTVSTNNKYRILIEEIDS